jgi:hypothetical protein
MDNVALDSVTARVNHEKPYYSTKINYSAHTLTPLKAIRRFCVECVGSPYAVDGCGGDKCLDGQGDEEGVCHFYRYRLGRGRPSVKLIRKMCLECMDGSRRLVAECGSDCELHRFRFGRNPNISAATREKQRMIALKRGLGG